MFPYGACFHFIGLFCSKALTVKLEKTSKIKSVPYQNGGLSFEKIPVGIGFDVLMYLSPHRKIYNRIG